MARGGLIFALILVISTGIFLWPDQQRSTETSPSELSEGLQAEFTETSEPIQAFALDRAAANTNASNARGKDENSGSKMVGQRVRVLSGQGTRPIAGAYISSFPKQPRFASWPLLRPAFFGTDQGEFLRRHANLAITDLHGFANLPHGSQTLAIEAEGKRGVARLTRAGSSLAAKKIRAFGFKNWPVRVVDEDGDPIEHAKFGIYSPRRKSGGNLIGVTNQDGRAEILIDEFSRQDLMNPEGYLYLESVGLPPIKIHLQPMEETQVTVPGLAPLLVEFLHPAGGLVTETLIYRLTTNNEDSPELLQGGCTQGRVVFPIIAPNSSFSLEVHDWDNHLKATAVVRMGVETPRSHRGAYQLKVQMEWNGFSLSGRLLDLDGSPMRLEHGVLSVGNGDSKNPKHMTRGFDTDGQGRFAVHFAPRNKVDWAQGWEGLDIRLLGKEPRGYSAVYLGLASSAFGPQELGDLSLSPPIVLAQGIVVDQFGNPDSTAHLTLETRDFRRDYKHERHGLLKERNESGEFVFYGPHHPGGAGPMFLSVKGKTIDSSSIEIMAPSKNLIVVARQKIHLSGEILASPSIVMEGFSVTMSRVDAPESKTETLRSSFSPLDYSFRDVQKGVYDLTLFMPSGKPVSSHKNVRLGHPQDTQRLPTFDLRGKLSSHLITVLSKQKEALGLAWIRVGENGKEIRVRRGGANLILHESENSILVGAYGMRSQSLTNLKPKEEIILDHGVNVLVDFPPGLILPDGWTLKVRLLQIHNGTTSPSGITDRWRTLHSDRANPFRLAGPGTYQIEMSLRGVGRGNRILSPVLLSSAHDTIEIPERGLASISLPMNSSEILRQLQSSNQLID